MTKVGRIGELTRLIKYLTEYQHPYRYNLNTFWSGKPLTPPLHKQAVALALVGYLL